jgi:hypothetical protein
MALHVTANGTYDLGLLSLNGTSATVDAGLTAVTINLTGALTTFTISSNSGSVVTINNTVNAASTINADTLGGSIILQSGVAAIGPVNATIDQGGSFSVGGTLVGLLNGGAINFSTGGGTAIFGTENSFLNLSFQPPFNGFTSSSDFIDDRALSFTGLTSYTVTGAGNTQTVSIASSGGDFSFTTNGSNLTPGTYSGATLNAGTLQFSSDGLGGTDITVCFLAGTRIRTPDGEADIETLKIGDPVLTADDRTLPVRWLGVNTVSTLFSDPLRTLPIRIRAGALADNVPARDLLVSPDHAMFIDGVLIHAGALVNGVSITREANMPGTFKYYHVEVADHALILAEGAPAESFVDNVDRMAFDNWSEHEALYGRDTPIAEMTSPRAKSARQIPHRTKARLEARAARFATELDSVA